MRKKIVAGNWKMNKTLDEALALTSEIAGMVKDEVRSDTTIVLCTPFPYLVPVLRFLVTVPALPLALKLQSTRMGSIHRRNFGAHACIS